jgi:sporulation protein YlmC with PRC-barrel domain
MTRSSTLALALFLGLSSAAMAQTSTDTSQQQAPAATQPAAPAAPSTAAQPETKSDSMQTTEQAKPAKPVQGQIVLQDENSILASTLIGSTVYTPADETVGDINDVIVGLDGKVQGVVIGVGGFLGLGEKDVAVKMDQITVQPQDANKSNVRLILNSTKADLEAAPEFKSVAAQNRETESTSTGSTTPTAPANPPASGSTNQ